MWSEGVGLLVVCVGMQVLRVVGDPNLAPITSPDSVGNAVDENSTIIWASIPPGAKYKASAEYDDDGMALLFDFARSFVNTCFPNGFPYDLIEKVIGGNLDLAAEAQAIVMDFLGYAIAVVIGLLFVVLFPLIGCCFCCCRCCGNCGGKRMQRRQNNAACKRKVFSVLLLAMVVMSSVGMVCVYVSNDRMTKALSKFSGIAVDNIDDVSTFLDNTIMQIQHIAKANFDFTKQVIFRDLDSLGYLVGIPVRTSLGTTAGINSALSGALELQSGLDSATADLQQVLTDIQHLTDNVTVLSRQLTDVKAEIDTSCSGTCSIDTSGLKTGFDNSQIPNITDEMSQLDKLQTSNLTATILQAKSQFDSIPEKVQNETAITVASLKNQVDDFSDRLEPMINMAEDLKTQALGALDLNATQDQIKSFAQEVAVYDQYRWYAGVGLSCVLLLILLLMFLGLMFGVFGSSTSELPTERGCVPNCGGNMLMIAVGFIFLFSWLLMLLTTITFLVGAPVERFVCQPLTDPELTVFTELIDEIGVFGGTGSILGDMLFQDPSVNLTIAGVLKDCRNGKSAYSTFEMNNFKDFNITALTDYKSSLDIEGQLNSINVDFSGITVLTPDLLAKFEDFKTAISGIDFAKFDELEKNTTEVGLSEFSVQLRNAASASTPPASITLNQLASDVDSIQSGSYTDTTNAKNTLRESSNKLDNSFAGILISINAVIDNLNSTQNVLQSNGSDMVKTEALSFADRLTSVVDSFISDAVNALEEDVGRCTPVYNIYASFLLNGFCHNIWDALNGFWFSLGWTLFFLVPSVIFAVKLAKHYRKMHVMDNSDNAIPEKNSSRFSNNGPRFGNNRVGHADKW